MPREITRKGIIKKLDSVVSQIVRERDKYCVNCGTPENGTCGHLFSRVAYSTRWDLQNCFRQCTGCNMRHEYDPYPLTNYFIEKFGKEAYDKLHKKFVTPKKYKTHELVELYEQLTQKASGSTMGL